MPLQIIRQDITKINVDAIVNPTNENMIGYSGIDYLIHRLAGAKLDKKCSKLAPLKSGEAKITKGYNLDAKYIIHTVGPIWCGGNENECEILKSCYIESLKLAVSHKCASVAFPLISSGNYGFPKDMVLKFAIQVITEFLFNHEIMVYICVFDRTSYEISKKIHADIKEIIDDDEAKKAEKSPTFSTRPFSSTSNSQESSPLSQNIDKSVPFSPNPPMYMPSCQMKSSAPNESLHEYMRSLDKPFALKLFDLIDKCGMSDVECYKKANVDKKTFSKIKCNPKTYKPSKQTAIAFAIALKLDLDETQNLLASAGLTLSQSFTFDKIIIYFIKKQVYNVFEINEALFEFDQVLLGC